MAIDLSSISGESFGDINEIFFKKDGKSLLDVKDAGQQKISGVEIAQQIAEATTKLEAEPTKDNAPPGKTIIQISKDVIDGDVDMQIELTTLEEKRRNTSSVRNKYFIDINTGEEIKVIEHTEMYNGTNLFTVKHSLNGRTITYPRGMFIGRAKRFVPKDYYIREAERAIEDTIDKNTPFLMNLFQDASQLTETPDGKFLELVLETPLNIIGGIAVPDKIQIPIKRMFDMDYKILMLENVICLDNKIAGLLFSDIWL